MKQLAHESMQQTVSAKTEYSFISVMYDTILIYSSKMTVVHAQQGVYRYAYSPTQLNG